MSSSVCVSGVNAKTREGEGVKVGLIISTEQTKRLAFGFGGEKKKSELMYWDTKSREEFGQMYWDSGKDHVNKIIGTQIEENVEFG